MAGLLVALGASACADDPSVEFGGDEPTKIQASPTVMFVNQGTPEFMLARLVDDRNRSTPTSFEISNVSAGITVTLDETFRPDYIGSDQLEFNPIQHVHRFIVTGVQAVGGEFTVSSQGISQVVKVNVVPSEIPLSLGAISNGRVDLTSENFTFTEETTVDFDGLVQSPIAVSADGHTVTVAVPGGLVDEVPIISGARASYMPTVALGAIPGSVGVTSTGTSGSPTIAGAMAIPLNFDELLITDRGNINGADVLGGGGPQVWYRFTVPADRHLDITLDWVGGNDLDWWLGGCDLNTQVIYQGTSAHPEHNAADVTAGEYCLAVIDFLPSPGAPTNFSIHIGP
jgi:hypothetical protein